MKSNSNISRKRKIGYIVFTTILLAMLLLPLLPLTVNAAPPNWLDNYTYTRARNIDGTADGIQTDYQMRITVAKTYNPEIRQLYIPNEETNAIFADGQEDRPTVWVPGDASYTMCGADENPVAFDDVIRWLPGDNAPTHEADLDTAVAAPAAVWDTLEGLIYVYGGNNIGGVGRTTAIQWYDPTTDLEGTLGYGLPVATDSMAASHCPVNGNNYIFGGNTAGGAVDTIYRHDPDAGNCQLIAGQTLTTGVYELKSVYHPGNNAIYIFGGFEPIGGTINEIHKFDCATETIAILGAVCPIAAEGFGVYHDSDEDLIVLAGGVVRNGANVYHDEIWTFDPSDDTTITTLPITLFKPADDFSGIYDPVNKIGYWLPVMDEEATDNQITHQRFIDSMIWDTLPGGIDVGTHCEDDFDDIRFTTSDGVTELDHWRETGSVINGRCASFWVKFDSIAAAPATTTFYMYYGDPLVASGSNMANTFPFSDDFPGVALDAQWAAVGTPTVAGGVVSLNDDDEIQGDTTFGVGYELEVCGQCDEQDVAFATLYKDRAGDPGDDRIEIFNSDTINNDDFNEYTLNTDDTIGADPQQQDDWLDFHRGTNYIFKIKRQSLIKLIFEMYGTPSEKNGLFWVQKANVNIPDEAAAPVFYVWDSSQESTYDIDWMFMRKIAPVDEPTFGTLGAEETKPPPTPAPSTSGVSDITGLYPLAFALLFLVVGIRMLGTEAGLQGMIFIGVAFLLGLAMLQGIQAGVNLLP